MGRTLAGPLRSEGYRVRAAATGLEALLAVPRVRANLIILDLMLPDIDGLILTIQLQQLTQAPIVICIARQGQIDRALALRLGATDFVAKPFDLDDLEARIEAALSHARERRASATQLARYCQ